MIRWLLSKRLGGYSIRRWFPTILALSIILTHAIASPFWYRIVAGTRITHTEIVASADMRRLSGIFLALNSYDDTRSSHSLVRRSIQQAIDTEYAGKSRAETRGAITLPVPTIFLELPDLQSEGRDMPGHQFRCDYRREDCSIMLQSSAYFVHILQGPNFISRLLVDRPLLAMRSVNQGVQLTGTRFPRPEFWHGGLPRSTERFHPSKTRLAITDGPALDENAFNHRDLDFSTVYNGTFISLPPFVAFDMDYTLDFREPASNFLVSCRVMNPVNESALVNEAVRADPCKFEIEDISLFTLSQCDATKGQCPSSSTDPVDDLKAHDFVSTGLTDNISLGFLDDASHTLIRMANRAGGSDKSTGLVDLPNRTEIVEKIIIDYLTIAGFSTQSAEFDRFLAANPDLDIGPARAAFQQVSPTLIDAGLAIALGRQPQLWAWHGYVAYIGPELLDGLAKDLVRMGLARPY